MSPSSSGASWARAENSRNNNQPSREIRSVTTPRRKWSDHRTRPEHLWIPDTQVSAGVPIEHIRWAAQYAIDQRPDVIIVAGDWWDFPSLNSHETEWADFRTRDLAEDLCAGLHAWDLFISTLRKAKGYDPAIVFIEGNHDFRFRRQYRFDARTKRLLRGPKWLVKHTGDVTWMPMEEIVCIDGVHYCHYFTNPMTSRALGGTALHKLNKLKFSYTMGHQQGKDTAEQYLANGSVIRGVVAGSFYQHDEDYKGSQGNLHWRGLIYKHEVRDGQYDLMEVSMDYLRRRYGGKRIIADGKYRASEFAVEEDGE